MYYGEALDAPPTRSGLFRSGVICVRDHKLILTFIVGVRVSSDGYTDARGEGAANEGIS